MRSARAMGVIHRWALCSHARLGEGTSPEPLTVVQHAKQIFAAVPKYGRQIERIWSQDQRDWLALSHRSRMVIARRSGHYIHLDQPKLTLRLIRRAPAQARCGSARGAC